MRKIRILIVDDSIVARHLLKDALADDPVLEVADVAATGHIALAKIPQVNPDIITLDVDMPEMSGLETLAVLRKDYPKLPVIMVSHLTEQGAAVTLEALRLGANDYVTKPSDVSNRGAAMHKLREELVPKIKAFCVNILGEDLHKDLSQIHLFPRARTAPSNERIDVVALGVSTGGPNALDFLVPQLPRDMPVPMLIVQHMPPVFTRYLADRLAEKSKLSVKEAVDGETLKAGSVWIAPGDFHMAVDRRAATVRLRTNREPPQNSCRPSVDALFQSVADAYGPHVLAVVMTGMGHDGFRGVERVHDAGGQVVVQDQASSVVWGMPGYVAKAGLADKIVPLDRMAQEILGRLETGRNWAVKGTGR